MTDTRFFNRVRELRALAALWEEPRAQLVTVWGRRRVGKSTLLARFAGGKPAVYLYGTRIAEAAILRGLAAEVAKTLDEPYLFDAPFPSWESALNYLAARSARGRLLVILDEFPYLCEVTPGLDTLVQRWWDRVRDSADLMLVLAGSAFTFMEGLTGATGALHGRRTGQIEVHSFDFADAARFFDHLAPTDRVRAYACYGGIPAYLSVWESGVALADMVERSLLAPGHFLFREGEELIRTEFRQEALYASILRAVATRQEQPSDIAKAAGKSSAADVFAYLRRLTELRLLRREFPITEWESPRPSTTRYRIDDPYLRFWYRFVSPFQSLIQLGRGHEVWERDISPALDEFVAYTTWEKACAQHLWHRLAADTLGVRFTHLGRWWDKQDEIDLVGLDHKTVTLVGECTWTNAPVDERVFVGLQRKATRLGRDVDPLWVLASRSGFTDSLRARVQGDPRVLLLEPADLA